MTPSLTSPSTDQLSNPDGTKRKLVFPPPFGVITTNPAGTRSGLSPPRSTTTSTPTPTSTTESAVNDAYDASLNKIQTKTTNGTLVACPWTGAPIRAIIPLPRRKLGANDVQDTNAMPTPSQSSVHGCSVPASTMVGSPPPSPTRPTFWDDDNDEDEEEEDEGSDDECHGRVTAQCCSYQSITATAGLSAWSFEELRVECYAQSLVARGTKPPPSARPALAIPPAFVPRCVPRN